MLCFRFLIWMTFCWIQIGPILVIGQDWLLLDQPLEYIDIGDFDVTGDRLTIEARIFQLQPSYGDIISKHGGPLNANYLLRPYGARLTTTNGFATTPTNCGDTLLQLGLNECFHIAMTYDGTSLKHWINGELNSQVSASGNMIQNNHTTKIGTIGSLGGNLNQEQFYGYLSEIRIWNTVRNQAQLQTFMQDTIPSPGSQPGLLAYYRFNELTNLANPGQHDGTPLGSPLIGAQDTFCQVFGGACQVLGGDISQMEGAANPYDSHFQPIFAPIKSGWKVQFRTKELGMAHLNLIDPSGRMLFQDKRIIRPEERVVFELKTEIPGLYLVRLTTNHFLITKKLWFR